MLEDYEMKTNEDEDDWSDFLNFVDVVFLLELDVALNAVG